MADSSSFMDWQPQTPPPLFNPYQGDYMPGGWPLENPTPPAPPSPGWLPPPRRRTPIDYILPATKRICTGLFGAAAGATRRTINATTTVVIVSTVTIVHRLQAYRREQRRGQRARRPVVAPLTQSPFERAVARENRLRQAQAAQTSQTSQTTRQVVIETPPRTPRDNVRYRTTPHPNKETSDETTENIPFEVPEFRPDHVYARTIKKSTPRYIIQRRRHKDVFPGMPRFTPPQEPKPFILPTPEEKACNLLLPEGVRLESPYPQLIPAHGSPSSPLSPPSSGPATPVPEAQPDLHTTTPVAQQQGILNMSTKNGDFHSSSVPTTPAAQLQHDLLVSAETGGSDDSTVVSSITTSRKRRIHVQGSRSTADGDTASTKRFQTRVSKAISPQTSTPAIVVHKASYSDKVDTLVTPIDDNLLSPSRFKSRKIITPKVLKTPKRLSTPKTPLSVVSSTCNISPLNNHIFAARSPVKSEISSFFEGSPPPQFPNGPRAVAKDDISSFFDGSPPTQFLNRAGAVARDDISSFFDGSPPAQFLNRARVVAKNGISSLFDGLPPTLTPEHPQPVRESTTTGGGSPTPASRTLEKAEEVLGSPADAPQTPTSDGRSTGNKSAVEGTQEETKSVASTPGEVTEEVFDMLLGLASPEATPTPNIVTQVVEQQSSSQDAKTLVNDSQPTPTEEQTLTADAPIDLTEDDDTGRSSSSELTSALQTPAKQLSRLHLDDDKYTTPEQPTPKASPHSVEKTTRRTRAEARREAFREEKNQYLIAPLAAQWEEKIQEALRRGHGELKASDFTRVVPLNTSGRGTSSWLNDEIINSYLQLVVKHGKKNDRSTQIPSHHAFSSFFYSTLEKKGYDGVRRWAQKAKIGSKSLLETEHVFIPINSGAHWTLCVVSAKAKRVTHYNSMSGGGSRFVETIKTWLKGELGNSYKESEWTFVATGESPLQANFDDCGVFTITSARQIMLGLTPMSYGPEVIPLQRKRIVAELVAGELLKSQ